MLSHIETMFFRFLNMVFHCQLGHPKVSNSEGAITVDQKIGRLQVTVGNSSRVEVLEYFFVLGCRHFTIGYHTFNRLFD